jgi:hypothetical protein
VRDQLNFEEVPIKLYLRKRQRNDQRDDIKSEDPEAGPSRTEASAHKP